MSSSEGHGLTRKRKDKKKSRHRGGAGVERSSVRAELRHSNDEDDDDEYDEDIEAFSPPLVHSDCVAAASTASSSGHQVGLLSAFVFVLLLAGLVALGAIIFVGLKDSNKEVSLPIGESRYASILSDFVDEHEDVDDHGGEVGQEDDVATSALLHEDDGDGEHCSEEDESAGGWGVDQFLPSDVADLPQEPSEIEAAIHEPSDDPQTLEEDKLEHESDDVQIAPPALFEEETLDVDDGGEVHVQPDVQVENEEMMMMQDDGQTVDGVTNADDSEIRQELDEAEGEIENWPEGALSKFDAILAKGRPRSPRANYGRARSLDVLCERQSSNALLEKAIDAYETIVTDLPDVPDGLFRKAAERCVERMRFRGFVARAVNIQKSLIKRFPAEAGLRNELAIIHLLLGQNAVAKQVLAEVLAKFPDDGVAKVHYGFILKTDDEDYPAAIRYLREGLASEHPGTVDGRFYFHLGDALARQGQQQQAMDVYEEGVARGVFLSVYQRSLYNVASLTGRPWWTSQQLAVYEHHLRLLEDNWLLIKAEGLALMDDTRESFFVPESEGLRDTGVWKQFELFARGAQMRRNCARAPRTCKLIEAIPDAAKCTRGQVKFSIMHPKTHVWAHTGPTNCRLRAHLGLVVPAGVRIRVANETRSWLEGQFIVFDDSFEHEVWHEGNSVRLVLIVDFWHPELTAVQKRTLPPI